MKKNQSKYCSAIVAPSKEYITPRKYFLHRLNECVRDRELTNALELLENRGYAGDAAISAISLIQREGAVA